jgi:hypothetical protein
MGLAKRNVSISGFFHGGLTAATTGKTQKNLWIRMDLDGFGWI